MGQLSEGVYFYNPLSTSVIIFNIREQLWSYEVSAFTSDVQEVKIQYGINYYPKRDRISYLYIEFGKDYVDKIVSPTVFGVIKAVMGQYTATQLVTKRFEITERISESLKQQLDNRDIVMTKFDITDTGFKEEFKNAIESKVIATQKAEESKNITARIQEEAKQKVIQAEA